MRRLLALILIVVACRASEVVLDAPDYPLVPGVATAATLRVVDPGVNVTAVELPQVAGLDWRMSGQNGSNISIINGARSQTLTIGLTMRASTRGVLAIPQITVQLADGTALRSLPTTLRCADGDARLTGDAHAEVAFDPPRIVPGQPTNLVYQLYLRRGEVQKLGIGPPEGSISLGDRSIVNGQTVDGQGRQWTQVTITWPLTHSTPGTYSVGGQQEFQYVVGDNLFNQRAVRGQIAVPSASLVVAELPSAGRPANFSGLIGPLSATMTLDRERVAASEGCLLSLVVTSRQTDLVKRPTIAVPGVQFYAKDDRSDAGTRTLTWDVVPNAPGVITIPSVLLPFFDPGSQTYRSADTPTLTLTVIPGRNRDLGVVGQQPSTATPVAAPAAPEVLVLPQPMRGNVAPRPAAWLGLVALVVGFAISAGALLAGRLLGTRRGPHRGRRLRAAGRDPVALDLALRELALTQLTAEQRNALDAMRSAVDRHRFGGEELIDLTAWQRLLEDVA